MIEEVEQNADAWDRLFPDSQRRSLAQSYVERVATIPDVKRVVAINVCNFDGATRQMLITVTQGENNPTVDAFDNVYCAYDEVCGDTLSRRALLGYPQVVTEDQYRDALIILPGYKDQEVTPLWENPSLKISA